MFLCCNQTNHCSKSKQVKTYLAT